MKTNVVRMKTNAVRMSLVADGHEGAEGDQTTLNPTARWLNANVAWGKRTNTNPASKRANKKTTTTTNTMSAVMQFITSSSTHIDDK